MKSPSILLGLVLVAAACDGPSDPDPLTDAPMLDAELRSTIGPWGVMPIGTLNPQNAAMVDLGQSLFFDKILSGNRDISCATCHDLTMPAIDGLSLAIGTGGTGIAADRTLGTGRKHVPRNAPTVVNLGLAGFYILWDGRVSGRSGTFDSPKGVVFPSGLQNVLAAQAMLPVLSRVEMRGNPGDTDVFGNPNELAVAADSVAGVWNAVMQRLLNIQAYVQKFQTAYPGVATFGFQHAANAIAAFEKQSFAKHNSPFDRYLALDNSALTADEKRGGILFFGRAGCASCHSGVMIGGDNFANIGVPQIGPGVGSGAPLDKGRGQHIADQNQGFGNGFTGYDFAFRVPALRNVELTAPYMHNGAYATLEAVLKHYTNPDSSMQNYDVMQLRPELRSTHHGDAATISLVRNSMDFRVKSGIKLTEEDRRLIIAFLKSLTDPAAKNLSSVIPAQVPSGLSVR